MNFLTDKIIFFFIKRDIIDEKYVELYKYSLETRLLSTVVWISAILLLYRKIGILASVWIILVVVVLRRRVNGYHVHTPLQCFLLTELTLGFAVYIILPCVQNLDIRILVGSFLIEVMLLMILKTGSHENNPMTEEELRVNNRYLKRNLWHLLGVAACISYCFKTVLFAHLTYIGVGIVVCTVVFEKLRKGESSV
ncbi:MAG: accessory gene regulator B family protein [Eubacteriales bacterium]